MIAYLNLFIVKVVIFIFTTDYKSEIRVFVENPYSNEYAERQERDDNILVYDGGVGSATEEFVNNLISFVDGKCNMIDSYVNLIDKTLRDEGFTYKGTTLGYGLVLLHVMMILSLVNILHLLCA